MIALNVGAPMQILPAGFSVTGVAHANQDQEEPLVLLLPLVKKFQKRAKVYSPQMTGNA
eukprot:m.200471 g.200471  ORF g.200471 m.200471 type:complete len:59 (+) comp15736_c0_seq4:351-527(+)